MGWRKETAAAILAVATLGVPTVVSASEESIHQTISTESSANQEEYKRHYQLALEIMEEFLKTSSDPFIQETYTEALQNPSEHIGIVDNLGYKGYDYYPQGLI